MVRLRLYLTHSEFRSTISEAGGIGPQEDETPFFCLLEDDRLISEVRVTCRPTVTTSARKRSQGERLLCNNPREGESQESKEHLITILGNPIGAKPCVGKGPKVRQSFCSSEAKTTPNQSG